MLWVGRDRMDHLVPTPLPRAGTPSTTPGCSNVLLFYSYARENENGVGSGEETTSTHKYLEDLQARQLLPSPSLVKLKSCREESNGKGAAGVGLETVLIADSLFRS